MSPALARILDALEKRYGAVGVGRPADAYDLIVRTNCGYPASEAACAKGYAALKATVGVSPEAILRAPKAKLTAAMRKGGIVPELRARRLRDIARRTQELEGSLRAFLKGPLRLGFGRDGGSYVVGYRTAQAALDAALPPTFDARIRAYVLFKQHGQEVCKRARPACAECPVTRDCAYFARARAGV